MLSSRHVQGCAHAMRGPPSRCGWAHTGRCAARRTPPAAEGLQDGPAGQAGARLSRGTALGRAPRVPCNDRQARTAGPQGRSHVAGVQCGASRAAPGRAGRAERPRPCPHSRPCGEGREPTACLGPGPSRVPPRPPPLPQSCTSPAGRCRAGAAGGGDKAGRRPQVHASTVQPRQAQCLAERPRGWTSWCPGNSWRQPTGTWVPRSSAAVGASPLPYLHETVREAAAAFNHVRLAATDGRSTGSRRAVCRSCQLQGAGTERILVHRCIAGTRSLIFAQSWELRACWQACAPALPATDRVAAWQSLLCMPRWRRPQTSCGRAALGRRWTRPSCWRAAAAERCRKEGKRGVRRARMAAGSGSGAYPGNPDPWRSNLRLLTYSFTVS